MRHKVKGRLFQKGKAYRKALYISLVNSLIDKERIRTTLPKAKEIRPIIEKLVTRSKTDSVANRRIIFNRLRDKKSVWKLFEKLGKRFADRPGGYVRILKLGQRKSDAAEMAIIEFVDYQIKQTTETKKTDKKTAKKTAKKPAKSEKPVKPEKKEPQAEKKQEPVEEKTETDKEKTE